MATTRRGDAGDREALLALVARTVEGEKTAACDLIASIQDDVYKLAIRMLGLRADAEDATQEISMKVLTHLTEFRAESSFRTWVWRIAARHLMRFRQTKREEIASFEMIEALIERGENNPPMPAVSEVELSLLVREVRFSCTQGMLLSLDRDQRIAWVLSEIFHLDGEEAAAVLEMESDAFRKRLSRARERLMTWMGKNCGLVDTRASCRCARQVPVALAAGVASVATPEYANHRTREGMAFSPRSLPLLDEASEMERTALALREHPDYAAPPEMIESIREIIESGRYRLLE